MSQTSSRGPIGSLWGGGCPRVGIGGRSPHPRSSVNLPGGCTSDRRSHGGISKLVSNPGYTVGVIHRITQESEGGSLPIRWEGLRGRGRRGPTRGREGGPLRLPPFPGEGTRLSRRLTSLRACRVASSQSSSLSPSDSQESGGIDVCRSA